MSSFQSIPNKVYAIILPINETMPTSTPDKISSPVQREIVSNRIFVACFKAMSKDELKDVFSNYGIVQSIEIIGHGWPQKQDSNSTHERKKMCAFITFDAESTAVKVVSLFSNITALHETGISSNKNIDDEQSIKMRLFSVVRYATPFFPRSAKHMSRLRYKEEQILEIIQQRQKPTILIQVNSSHLQRITEYIADLENEAHRHPFHVPLYIGSSSKMKNISIIFLHLKKKDNFFARSYWYNFFMHNEVLARFVVRNTYAVDHIINVNPSKQKGEHWKSCLLKCALDQMNSLNLSGNIILKVQTFPPKQNNLQYEIIAHLNNKISEIEKNNDSSFEYSNLREKNLSLSPTEYTHIVSFVQIFSPKDYYCSDDVEKDTVDEIFSVGILPVLPSEKEKLSNVQGKVKEENKITRAYFKLKEAMDNFRRDKVGIPVNFQGVNAFDCGSSPGGWTKYLLQKEKCNLCYSCDPGALNDSVNTMDGAMHLQMKACNAINLLQKEGKTVSLWVSDMCLIEPHHQVDHLLMAKKKGILIDGSYFVLTLKFNTGHSKNIFDKFAEQELQRLRENVKVENVQVYHLFSNRKGERTLIGQIF